MDKEEFTIAIESKQGRRRSITRRESLLCLGSLDLSAKSLENAAIKFTKDGQPFIDKFKCSKCYLCKLKSKHIKLDEQHFPIIVEEEDEQRYDLTTNDQLYFERSLSEYKEEEGISKWIYAIFRIFGLSKTFTEVAINKEEIPRDILEELGETVADGVYKKSVIPDIESSLGEFVFVFENKKFALTNDDWIEKAIKQITLYAHSNVYRNKENNVIFIFCYNGADDITDRVINVIEKNPRLKKFFYDIFVNKPNYKFVLLPSAEIFRIVSKVLRENRKDEKWISSVILTNIKSLPLR